MSDRHQCIRATIKNADGVTELTIETEHGPIVISFDIEGASNIGAALIQAAATLISFPDQTDVAPTSGVKVADFSIFPLLDRSGLGLLTVLEPGGAVPLRFDIDAAEALSRGLNEQCKYIRSGSVRKH